VEAGEKGQAFVQLVRYTLHPVLLCMEKNTFAAPITEKMRKVVVRSARRWRRTEKAGQVVFVLLFLRLFGFCKLTVNRNCVHSHIYTITLPPQHPPHSSIHQLTNTETEPYNELLAVFPVRLVFRFLHKGVHPFFLSGSCSSTK